VNNYLIDLLKKTKFRKRLGTNIQYYKANSLWNANIVQTIYFTSFDNQKNTNQPPGENVKPNNPPNNPTVVDYIVSENNDFLISENNDNIIV
jgi:hypothetical protein